MKLRILVTLMAALLLTSFSGCSLSRNLDAAGNAVGRSMDAAEDSLERSVHTTAAPSTTGTLPQNGQAKLTREQAEAIALEHAGFTAEQVTYLRAEYEVDDGIPQYDVHFHQGHWEYEYEIHADRGKILSFEKDD